MSDDDLHFAERAATRAAPVAADHRRKSARLPVTLPAMMRQLDSDGTPFGEERKLVTRDISLGAFAVGTGVGASRPARSWRSRSCGRAAGRSPAPRRSCARARCRRCASSASTRPARIRLVGFLAALRSRAAVSRASARTA